MGQGIWTGFVNARGPSCAYELCHIPSDEQASSKLQRITTQKMFWHKFCGFHCSSHSNCDLLSCDSMQSCRETPAFWRNMMPPSSGTTRVWSGTGQVTQAGCNEGYHSELRRREWRRSPEQRHRDTIRQITVSLFTLPMSPIWASSPLPSSWTRMSTFSQPAFPINYLLILYISMSTFSQPAFPINYLLILYMEIARQSETLYRLQDDMMSQHR
jgi:hypothetical protein